VGTRFELRVGPLVRQLALPAAPASPRQLRRLPGGDGRRALWRTAD